MGNSNFARSVQAIANPKFNWDEGLRQSDKFVQNIQKGKMQFAGLSDLMDSLKNKSKALADEQVRVANAFSRQIGPGQIQMYIPAANTVKNFANDLELANRKLAIQSEMLSSVGTHIQNWGKNTQWAGRQLMVGFTIPFAAAAGAAGVYAYQIDKELTRIQKVYDGSTKGLRESALETAKSATASMGVSTQDTLKVMSQLASTGKTGRELMQGTIEVQRLATLGEMDYQQALESTISLQTTFKMSTTELADSINYMNSIENATSLSMNDFAEAIPRAAAPVAQLGGSLQDLGTIMVAMKERGVDAAEGANAIKSTMNRLLNPGKQTQQLFRDLTGKDLKAFIDSTNGELMPTMQGLADTIMGSNLTLVDQQRLIGQLSGSYQLTRMTSILDGLASATGQVARAQEVAKQGASEWGQVAARELEAQTQSASGKFKIAMEGFKVQLQEFGEIALKAATFVIGSVGKMLEMINALPDWVKTALLGGAGILAIAGPIAMLVGIFGNFIGTMVKGGAAVMRMGNGYKSMTIDQKAASLSSENFNRNMLTQADMTQILIYQLEKLQSSYIGVSAAQNMVMGKTAAAQSMRSYTSDASRATSNEKKEAERLAYLEQRKRYMEHPDRSMLLQAFPTSYAKEVAAPRAKAQAEYAKLKSDIASQEGILTSAINTRKMAVQEALAQEKILYHNALKETAAESRAMLLAQGKSVSEMPTMLSTAFGSLKQDSRGRWQKFDEETGKMKGFASKEEVEQVKQGFNTIAVASDKVQDNMDRASVSSRIFRQESALGLSVVSGIGASVAQTGSGFQQWLMWISLVTGALTVVAPMLSGIGPAFQKMGKTDVASNLNKQNGKIKSWATGMVSTIGGLFSRLPGLLTNPWVLGGAGVGLAIWGIQRLVTAENRKQVEHMQALANSTDGWMKTLGRTKLEWGQILDQAGQVKDTVDSLVKKFREDNPDLVKELSGLTGDRLNQQSRYEAFKLQGQGLSQDDIIKGLEIALKAAGKTRSEIDAVLGDIRINFDFQDGRRDLDVFAGEIKNRFKEIGQYESPINGDMSSFQYEVEGETRQKAAIEQTKSLILDRLAGLSPTEKAVFSKRLAEDYKNAYAEGFEELKNKYGSDLSKDYKSSINDLLSFTDEKGFAPKMITDQFGEPKALTNAQRDLALMANSERELTRQIALGLGVNGDRLKGMKQFSDLLPLINNGLLDSKTVQQNYNDAVGQAERAGSRMTDEEKLKLAALYGSATGYDAAKLAANGYSQESARTAEQVMETKRAFDAFGAALAGISGRANDFWSDTANMETGFEAIGDSAAAQANKLTETTKSVYSGAMNMAYDSMASDAESIYQGRIDSIVSYFESRKDALNDEGKATDKAWDATMRQFSDDWDARMEASRKQYEDREKAINNEADTQIKAVEGKINAIKAEEDAAKELDDERQRMFEAEERRIERLTELANRNIDYNRAVASGNLDEAARVQNNTERVTVGWSIEDGQLGSEERARQRGKLSDQQQDDLSAQKDAIEEAKKAKLDALKEEEDAVTNSLERQKEAQQRALDDQKAMERERLQDRIDSLSKEQQFAEATERRKQEIDRKTLEIQLATLRAFVPMNEAELNAHIERVQGAYNEHGIQLEVKGGQWGQVVGNALQSNVDLARAQMSNDQRWQQFGNSVAAAITQGAFGMSLDQFFNMIITGSPPEGWAPAGVPYSPTADGGRNSRSYYHTGGMIGVDAGGRAGKSGGLHSDEIPMIGQKGEFMVNKNAASKLGPGYLNMINQGIMPAVGGGSVGGIGALMGGMIAVMMGAMVKGAFLEIGNKAGSDSSSMWNGSVAGKAGSYGGVELDDEQIGYANVIANVGKSMGASQRDIVIALMTAMQESNIRNLNYGDRDSVGLFQQRTSQGWGTIAQIMNPEYSSRKFYEGLLGLNGRDSMSLTEAAQAVQRSAFPDAYAKWQSMAEALVGAGVGSMSSTRGGFGALGRMAENILGGGGTGKYIKPANGSVSSEYGWRTDPINGSRALHDGIDIAAPGGTPIYATADGVVAQAGFNNGGFGNWTLLSHSGGLMSGYAHQSRIDVGNGQRVRQGQIIGAVGTTGRSTGNHLHFQMGPGPGSFQNPRTWIPSLDVGGNIKYDNTLANLHKNETVLTAPLSQSLKTGINNMTAYKDPNIYVTINGTSLSEKQLQAAIRNGIMDEKQLEMKKRGVIK